MIRKPLRAKPTGRGLQKASTLSLPAPVGGWNVRDPLAAMAPTDAVVLENWFPKANDVELRPGAVSWATGFTSQPLTLMPWNGPSSSKLFAATSTAIYDATAGAAIGASLSTVTNGYLQYTNFQVAGGQYLVAVNGQDKLKLYNGTAWADIDGASVPAITGLPTTSLANVAVACRRLWFVQKSSSSAWYLPVASIGGALVEFPLGAVFGKGGYLVSIGTWTIDGGDGSDDYTVFMSSEGEIAVYKGIDPASSATFAKVGVYYIGEPIGRNCFCKYGGDLLVLCQNGLFPLSKALQSATINRAAALTAKIDTAFTEAATLYSDNPGWQVIAYPQGSFVLVNIPITASYTIQYVMNSITGAWCVFTGWLASAWEVFDKTLYFASDNKTAKAWTGRSDFGAAVVGRAQQAYSTFKNPAKQKHFKLIRPLVVIDGNVTLHVGFDADYAVSDFSSLTTAAPTLGYPWDAANTKWDQVTWGSDNEAKREWATVLAKECYAAAFRLQVATTSVSLKWSATDFVYEVGGIL